MEKQSNLPNVCKRQPTESEAAWNAYQFYRDNGRKFVAFKSSHTRRNAYTWSRKYKWRERIVAIDNMKESAIQAERINQARKEAEQTMRRHGANAQAYTAIMMKLHTSFLNKFKTDEDLKQLERMTAKELLQLIFQGARLIPALQEEERNARGIYPILSIRNDIDFSKMTDEELQQFIVQTTSLVGSTTGAK